MLVESDRDPFAIDERLVGQRVGGGIIAIVGVSMIRLTVPAKILIVYQRAPPYHSREIEGCASENVEKNQKDKKDRASVPYCVVSPAIDPE
jgi:hypothetical protein